MFTAAEILELRESKEPRRDGKPLVRERLLHRIPKMNAEEEFAMCLIEATWWLNRLDYDDESIHRMVDDALAHLRKDD